MPVKSEEKPRKRLVVEEVSAPTEPKIEETSIPQQSVNEQPINEVKEKVEELQTITEHMGSDIKESEDIQEDLAKAVDEVQPREPQPERIEEPIDQGKNTNPLWIIIPGIFLLGALLGGIIFYQKSLNKTAAETPSPSPASEINASTPTPIGIPISQVDFAKYPILVRNGSGIPGEASNVSSILTSGGFSVSGTGNADSYDFTKTFIQAKANVPASFITKLSDTLSKTYVVDKPQSLPDSSTNEVVVIVGSSKN